MGSVKAKVCLKDISKVMVHFDTGIEINIMTKELIKDANLAMRRGPKLESVLYTGYSRPFFNLYKDMEIPIGGLKTRHPIFMIEVGDYNLIID